MTPLTWQNRVERHSVCKVCAKRGDYSEGMFCTAHCVGLTVEFNPWVMRSDRLRSRTWQRR
jgi:hypothetical protein